MNNNKIIQQIEAAQLKTDLPDYAPGDTIQAVVENQKITLSRQQ